MEEEHSVFFYALIRSDYRRPLEELAWSKVGGQQDDGLVKIATKYLQDKYYPRSDKSGASGGEKDEETAVMLQTMVLTEPTEKNGYRSVCMYYDSSGSCGHDDVNKRATELLLATGRTLPQDQREGLCGDVFIGRHYDDGKTWTRVDFRPDHIDPCAKWVKLATKPGGGGVGVEEADASRSYAAAFDGDGKAVKSQKVAKSSRSPAAAKSEKKKVDDGTPAGSTDFMWSQSDEEVEITFNIADRIEARKDVKVSFDPSSLKVIVDGMVLADGHTGGLVVTDDSLFTVQNGSKDDGKELCITLVKDSTERHEWPYAVSRGK